MQTLFRAEGVFSWLEAERFMRLQPVEEID